LTGQRGSRKKKSGEGVFHICETTPGSLER
jgi:hypothetical protein